MEKTFTLNLNGKQGVIYATPCGDDAYAVVLLDTDKNFLANLLYEETTNKFSSVKTPEEFYDLIAEPLEKAGTLEEMKEYLGEYFDENPYLNRIGETYCLMRE